MEHVAAILPDHRDRRRRFRWVGRGAGPDPSPQREGVVLEDDHAQRGDELQAGRRERPGCESDERVAPDRVRRRLQRDLTPPLLERRQVGEVGARHGPELAQEARERAPLGSAPLGIGASPPGILLRERPEQRVADQRGGHRVFEPEPGRFTPRNEPARDRATDALNRAGALS